LKRRWREGNAKGETQNAKCKTHFSPVTCHLSPLLTNPIFFYIAVVNTESPVQLLFANLLMKKFFFLLLLVVPLIVSGQAVSYPKTLPLRSYSIGLCPTYNGGKGNMDEGPGIFINGGFPVNYSYDLSFSYGWFPNGPDYFSADLKWLFREQRRQYFSAIIGMHYFYEIGLDATAVYTYTVNYNLNLATGLDMDLNFNNISGTYSCFWLPLNIGYNADDRVYFYVEYDLPVSEWAWDVVALGATIVIR